MKATYTTKASPHNYNGCCRVFAVGLNDREESGMARSLRRALGRQSNGAEESDARIGMLVGYNLSESESLQKLLFLRQSLYLFGYPQLAAPFAEKCAGGARQRATLNSDISPRNVRAWSELFTSLTGRNEQTLTLAAFALFGKTTHLTSLRSEAAKILGQAPRSLSHFFTASLRKKFGLEKKSGS